MVEVEVFGSGVWVFLRFFEGIFLYRELFCNHEVNLDLEQN